jgi:hypothetical protein
MASPRLEFGEARISFANSEKHSERAQRIARLIFERVGELIERDLQHLQSSVVLERLETRPVEVAFDELDDEGIAQKGAAEIYRALQQALYT